MNDLDEIPWKDLTHAYGSAEDVPDLLRALRTASPDVRGEGTPLWELFGNIWHQGTVYEATAYAVPFLIELVMDQRTPDRIGILNLLSEIACGSSYLDVEGDERGEIDSKSVEAQDILWARNAHNAIASGFSDFVELTREVGDVKYAAACVLSRFPEHGAAVAEILRRLLDNETRAKYRAGILRLIGATRDRSIETLEVLSAAVEGSGRLERCGAAFAMAHLKVDPLSPGAMAAIMETIENEDLESDLEGLPWDAFQGHDESVLYTRLDAAHQVRLIDRFIAALESGNASSHVVWMIATLLFPMAADGKTPKVTAHGMSELQARAVRSLYSAQREAIRKDERLFEGYFPQYGLPDEMREWRALATGHAPEPVDMSLPLLADATSPDRPIAPRRLKVGQKVVHRHFGIGKVTELKVDPDWTRMTVRFEDEGFKILSLPSGG